MRLVDFYTPLHARYVVHQTLIELRSETFDFQSRYQLGETPWTTMLDWPNFSLERHSVE